MARALLTDGAGVTSYTCAAVAERDDIGEVKIKVVVDDSFRHHDDSAEPGDRLEYDIELSHGGVLSVAPLLRTTDPTLGPSPVVTQ